MTLNQIFAKNLAEVMARKCATPTSLQKLSGVSHSHVGAILDGRYGTTLKLMQKLCTALEVEPSAMLEE
jgi:DNA-binding Xre family transcriptional regulator